MTRDDARRVLVDPFVSTTRRCGSRIVERGMTLIDLLIALTPIVVLLLCLAWRAVPTLIEWRGERKYQAEWHRTFGAARRRSS